MRSILDDIALGLLVERLMEIWLVRLIFFALMVILVSLVFYKDIKYWLTEKRRKKNQPVVRNKSMKGIVTLSEGKETRVNPILYFFFVLNGILAIFVFIITFMEKF